MPTITKLPSGKYRAQVRIGGVYRGATFGTKREARDWATIVEGQAHHVAASGFAPPPKDATLADLIDKYLETVATHPGKTKAATLTMFKRDALGKVSLSALSAMVLADFVDRRLAQGAGGVTVAADLSFLSAVLKWARHARRWDLPAHLPADARASLVHRRVSTRSRERDREPTPEELARLYAHWQACRRQRIDMETLCRFALASGMRQDEICRIEVDDVDRAARTVVIRDRKDPRVKQGNDQVVPLLPDAWAIVAPLLDGRAGERIFGDLRTASVSTAFTRACQQLGIVDLHFHDLRHAATAQFFRMGLDIPRVALLTGHKTWQQLRRYTDIKPSDVHEAVARHTTERTNLVPLRNRRAKGSR